MCKENIKNALLAKGQEREKLFFKASNIRQKHCGNKVYVRGVLEISNYCKCNCGFCGNAFSSKRLNRYRLTLDNILNQIDFAHDLGIDVIHLASGSDPLFDFEIICRAVQYIISKDMVPELALGQLTNDQYDVLFNHGARRFILKFETSDFKLFSRVKSCQMGLNSLIDTIQNLIDRGGQVGTGNIIGLPGQTIDTIVDDLFLMSRLQVSMASTSVFIPNAESAFAKEAKGDPDLALNYLALLRIIKSDKNISIPSNSTLGTIGKKCALQIASNELSLNITPFQYRGSYSIYSGKNRYLNNYEELNEIISKSGCQLSTFKSTVGTVGSEIRI
ncbi:biotin synthase BioB [Fumia xinanensis]|uniref:Radical SAM protein n=1 Tax=Fumia xinanensis TaxID=2763659 RepID=A0A926E3S6_9FIRM|nr:radical SAM protein [Fumia xinanensis]MBC8560736.1 radical SAM protein [Fumia xinanensis]